MANTKSKNIDKYNKKVLGLVNDLVSTDAIYSDAYRESLINQAIDILFRLKFTIQGGGK